MVVANPEAPSTKVLRVTEREQEVVGVSFLSATGHPLLSILYRGLYDEQNHPIAAHFAFWETLKQRYASGQLEVEAEKGAIRVAAPA
jgi:hypothetical protein